MKTPENISLSIKDAIKFYSNFTIEIQKTIKLSMVHIIDKCNLPENEKKYIFDKLVNFKHDLDTVIHDAAYEYHNAVSIMLKYLEPIDETDMCEKDKATLHAAEELSTSYNDNSFKANQKMLAHIAKSISSVAKFLEEKLGSSYAIELYNSANDTITNVFNCKMEDFNVDYKPASSGR